MLEAAERGTRIARRRILQSHISVRFQSHPARRSGRCGYGSVPMASSEVLVSLTATLAIDKRSILFVICFTQRGEVGGVNTVVCQRLLNRDHVSTDVALTNISLFHFTRAGKWVLRKRQCGQCAGGFRAGGSCRLMSI